MQGGGRGGMVRCVGAGRGKRWDGEVCGCREGEEVGW